MEASVSGLVNAPRDEVWRTLADFGAISAWGGGVDHSTMLTASELGEGSVRRVQVGRNTLRETVVVWEPGQTLSYEITGLPPVVRHARNTWTLADAGTGTQVTLTSSVVVPRPPGVGKLLLKQLIKADEKLLAGLKESHEA